VEGFNCEVPSSEAFDLLRQMLPTLSRIRTISEKMSADDRPTTDRVLWEVYKLRARLNDLVNNTEGENTGINEWAKFLLAQVDQRFPNCGADFYSYAVGHLLNPVIQGWMLKRTPKKVYDEVIHNLINEDPSTPVFRQKSVDALKSMAQKKWVDADDDDDLDAELKTDMFEERLKETQDSALPPIKSEMRAYLECKDADPSQPDYSILKWWREHKASFPRLAQFARAVLCQPVSSASSERAFSQAGLVMTDRRQNLSTKTLEKLCFVNQNFKALAPMIKKWRVESHAEVYTPPQDPDKAQEADDLDASQLGPSVPMWKGLLARGRVQAAGSQAGSEMSDDVLIIDEGDDPSASSTPSHKRFKKDARGGKHSKPKPPPPDSQSQSLLDDDDDAGTST
jgi:hypothetical protein